MKNKYRTDVENFVDAVSVMDSDTIIEIRLINNGKNGSRCLAKQIQFRNFWQGSDELFRLTLAMAYRDLMKSKSKKSKSKEDEPWTRADDLEMM